jgi:MoxR-like ATPase
VNDVREVVERAALLRSRLDEVILGQAAVKEQALACLFAGGHALLEGVPGTGKTLLVLALSRLLGCAFRRVQLTPDLMPSDLLGTNIWNPKSHEFEFHAGPVFTDLLLADEVNRTPPRTQSALLEAMQEHAVTIDGTRRETSPAFTVFATQNPVEFEGTYPLPEAQKDRFLLKIDVPLPADEDEARILAAYAEGRRLHDDAVLRLEPVLQRDDLVAARRTLAQGVRVEPRLLEYIRLVVRTTREHEGVQLGAGPRASLALLFASRALAGLRGRDYVIPDDVKELALPVLAHRVLLLPEAEMEGTSLEDVVRRVFEAVEVPR